MPSPFGWLLCMVGNHDYQSAYTLAGEKIPGELRPTCTADAVRNFELLHDMTCTRCGKQGPNMAGKAW